MCMSRAAHALFRIVSREFQGFIVFRDVPGTAARGEKSSIVGVLHL